MRNRLSALKDCFFDERSQKVIENKGSGISNSQKRTGFWLEKRPNKPQKGANKPLLMQI
jgi:hypothetical protein